MATLTEEQREKIFANAESLGRLSGMIDTTDLRTIDISDLRLAADGSVPGLDEKIAKLKEAKPHWFLPPIDPDKPFEPQIQRHAELLRLTEDARIKKFFDSKPNNDRIIQAIETGDFSC